MGGTIIGSGLQTIDYQYNIRGWMPQINNPNNLNGGDLFGYEIKYTNPENTNVSTGRFNGNIAEVDWKTSLDGVHRKYSYQYDGLNRLSYGRYSEPFGTVPQEDHFGESLEYDLNGNITHLYRNAKNTTTGTAMQIDNLSYSYSGNRLTSVTDQSTNYQGYPDISGNTISYDLNGNMKNQIDKGILNIDYNFLNLPKEIKLNQSYIIRNPATGEDEERNVRTAYTYRADGTKLRKKHTVYYNKGGTERTSITDYLDGFQYTINYLGAVSLEFVPTSEGYYNFKNNKYIYHYTDHLGNIRLSYFNGSGDAEVLEENNYYPFRLKHEGYNALAGNTNYNYQYNGKELQNETGMYDYGARFYMPDIGRWGVVDPLAEASRRFTPYHYGNNNPIRFIDPDGRLTMDNLGTYSRGSAVASFMNRNGFGDDHLPMLYSDDAGMMIVNEALGDNGQGGGSGDPKPSFWQRAGNFFRNLFRGKSKQADVLPITGAAARPIQVGQLEKVGRVLTIEQVTAALATIMGKSVWALPLILNGDSAGAKGYDIPLTGATDVPTDETEPRLTLYRGVCVGHYDYKNALKGMAVPLGGHSDPGMHNWGDTESVFTSWTTNINTALKFANKNGSGGILLSKDFPIHQVIPSPDKYNEQEILIRGTVVGAFPFIQKK